MPRYDYKFAPIHTDSVKAWGDKGYRVLEMPPIELLVNGHLEWAMPMEREIPDTGTPAAAAPSVRETRLVKLLSRVLALETEYFLPAGLLSDIEQALRP